jgi:hypothetical protein
LNITLGTLKNKRDELATFLEPRIGAKLSVSGDSLEVEDASIRAGVRPRHVKTYIKRFMYMQGVKKNYRVFVSGGELTIQEIELGKEEEEKKKEQEEKGKEKAEEARKEETAKVQDREESSEEEKEEPAAAKVQADRESEKEAGSKKETAKKKKVGSKKETAKKKKKKTEPED